MPAILWSGTISFGLVVLPVHITSAVTSESISFKMLHAEDYSPLERKYFCPKEDKVVPSDEIARGFPAGEDNYIIVTDSELESLEPERSKSIEIERFVDLEAIEPIYYDRPYYIIPEEGSERPYSLLVKALDQTGQAGIAQFVMKEREYLVAVYTIENALGLNTLHFERQKAATNDITPKKTRVSHDELDDLVEHIRKATRSFDPGKFKDEYEIELMKIVHKKAKKKGAVKTPQSKRKKIKKSKVASKVKKTLDRVKDK
jgi:DNA end-binding protein Ku